MLHLIKRLLDFSGHQQKNLILSFIYSLVDSIFEMIPILAILTILTSVLSTISGGVMTYSSIWTALLIMVISIAGRIFFNKLATVKRTLASLSMCAEKRLEIGEHLKRVPMGYFSENRPGEIAATVTTTLDDIEDNGVAILERIAGGFIHALVIGIWLLFYEWHIGLLMFLGLAISMILYPIIQKAGKKHSPRRQKAQANLVVELLEYVKGMGVIKAYGLGSTSEKAVDNAINESAKVNILLESSFSILSGFYQSVFRFVRSVILIVAPYLLIDGEINPEKCLLLLISSFIIYSSVELIGSLTSIARVIEVSLERLATVTNAPILDENGREISLNNHEIKVKNVSFGYDKELVINNVNFEIPEKTTCAIVGPSGSGKTTLVSLIARFWDVHSGSISIGGHNIKEFTCDSLLKNFSIVFQNVYLFEDTIEHNIKFGKPDSTDEEMISAAKKACCHDFIMALPKGYQTMVGEGGANLSGGEKQRISFARAILKDAPIIVLDEATASVDPENQRELQEAIFQLTKNKTIIMIAHRLSTVRNADQIIVLDKGQIVQQGTHNELIKQPGIYQSFVDVKEQAIGWKLFSN